MFNVVDGLAPYTPQADLTEDPSMAGEYTSLTAKEGILTGLGSLPLRPHARDPAPHH